MSNLGFAGAVAVSPITFITNLTNFIPGGYAIIYYGCILAGLIIIGSAVLRQIETAKGRGEHKLSQNLFHALFGAGFAVLGEYIGYIGQSVFGQFQDVSTLLYVAKQSDSLAKIAIVSFMYVLQFIGVCCVIVGWRQANLIVTGKSRPDQTGTGVLWFIAGGLSLVFIQYTIGIAGAFVGFPIASFINNL